MSGKERPTYTTKMYNISYRYNTNRCNNYCLFLIYLQNMNMRSDVTISNRLLLVQLSNVHQNQIHVEYLWVYGTNAVYCYSKYHEQIVILPYKTRLPKTRQGIHVPSPEIKIYKKVPMSQWIHLYTTYVYVCVMYVCIRIKSALKVNHGVRKSSHPCTTRIASTLIHHLRMNLTQSLLKRHISKTSLNCHRFLTKFYCSFPVMTIRPTCCDIQTLSVF